MKPVRDAKPTGGWKFCLQNKKSGRKNSSQPRIAFPGLAFLFGVSGHYVRPAFPEKLESLIVGWIQMHGGDGNLVYTYCGRIRVLACIK
jgi:hypothetical protein